MLSDRVKQTSCIDVLPNSQNNIQKLEKMTNSIALSTFKDLSEKNNSNAEEDNNNKIDQNITTSENFNSLYQLQNLPHMNKYLNESSNIKFNNSEEFKEYQKYKEDLVNKIKSNKIATHKILDKDSLFNDKGSKNDLITSNTHTKDSAINIQDEYLHENPKTEPNPDIIVVSNVDDTTVTITENNPPNEKKYFTMNQINYQTNRYNNEYKSYIPINSRSSSNLNSTAIQNNIDEVKENNSEDTSKLKETQIEINVSECKVIENGNIYNNNNNKSNEQLINKQEKNENISISSDSDNNNNSNNNNSNNDNNNKYEEYKSKAVSNVSYKSMDNYKKNGYNDQLYNNYSYINQNYNPSKYRSNYSYNLKNKNSYINYTNNNNNNNTNLFYDYKNSNDNNFINVKYNNSLNVNTIYSNNSSNSNTNNYNQKSQNYINSISSNDYRKSYNKNTNLKYDNINKNYDKNINIYNKTNYNETTVNNNTNSNQNYYNIINKLNKNNNNNNNNNNKSIISKLTVDLNNTYNNIKQYNNINHSDSKSSYNSLYNTSSMTETNQDNNNKTTTNHSLNSDNNNNNNPNININTNTNINSNSNNNNNNNQKYNYNNSYYSNTFDKMNANRNYNINTKPYEKKVIGKSNIKEIHKGYTNYKFSKEYKVKTEEEKFNEMLMRNIEKARMVKRHGPKNKGYDDENNDYIVVEHELIDDRYYVINQVGKGSFGLVCHTIDICSKKDYAVKIIKNKSSFYSQAQIEIKILEFLNEHDPDDQYNVVKLKRYFVWHHHLCLVYDMLYHNLYELEKETQFNGIPLETIRKYAYQLLIALKFLSQPDVNIIHCDLKPENVLLCSKNSDKLQLIDFGSSCFYDERTYTYIQSRFYRSPEVLLNHSYSTAIDMWSLGCTLMELLTGEPLFNGCDEHDQIYAISRILGPPPQHMIDKTPVSKLKKILVKTQNGRYQVGSRHTVRPKRTIWEIIKTKMDKTRENAKHLKQSDENSNITIPSVTDYIRFKDLIENMLNYDPDKRIKPDEALKHPFFRQNTGYKYDQYFQQPQNSNGNSYIPRINLMPRNPYAASIINHTQKKNVSNTTTAVSTVTATCNNTINNYNNSNNNNITSNFIKNKNYQDTNSNHYTSNINYNSSITKNKNSLEEKYSSYYDGINKQENNMSSTNNKNELLNYNINNKDNSGHEYISNSNNNNNNNNNNSNNSNNSNNNNTSNKNNNNNYYYGDFFHKIKNSSSSFNQEMNDYTNSSNNNVNNHNNYNDYNRNSNDDNYNNNNINNNDNKEITYNTINDDLINNHNNLYGQNYQSDKSNRDANDSCFSFSYPTSDSTDSIILTSVISSTSSSYSESESSSDSTSESASSSSSSYSSSSKSNHEDS